jgi:hypothetical protein
LPGASAQYATDTPIRNSRPIAANTAQPCRSSRTMRPNTLVSPAPSVKIRIIWTRFVIALGFSIGMRGIGVEEPAAIRAQHLDDFL